MEKLEKRKYTSSTREQRAARNLLKQVCSDTVIIDRFTLRKRRMTHDEVAAKVQKLFGTPSEPHVLSQLQHNDSQINDNSIEFDDVELFEGETHIRNDAHHDRVLKDGQWKRPLMKGFISEVFFVNLISFRHILPRCHILVQAVIFLDAKSWRLSLALTVAQILFLVCFDCFDI